MAKTTTPIETHADPRDTRDVNAMNAALGLARRALGSVWPNPAVGCVVTDIDGRVIGRGWTQPGGRPHAETEALARAGARAKGATVHVSLEPCSHHGETPPCAEALVEAGIARVVVALEDPDPRVSGGGLARLREAGIEVVSGVCAEAAAMLNAGFFLRLIDRRPLVTLKLASTLDGRIATATGDSRWITGQAARRAAHLLRASHDAILIGAGTALADDPDLGCRLPGLEARSPLRLVADDRLEIVQSSKLVQTARQRPTWVLCRAGADPGRRRALSDVGVEVIEIEVESADAPTGQVADTPPRTPVAALLRALGERGLTRLLVEGGSHLAADLLAADLVDRLEWFHAPSVIGGDGLAAVQGFGVEQLIGRRSFQRIGVREIGQDLLESYARLP